MAGRKRREDRDLGGGPERRPDERSEDDRRVGAPPRSTRPADATPDSEVPEKARRRRFTAEYKLCVLREADSSKPGEVGRLLRREGLYSSHLTSWRKQRADGQLQGLAPKKRGKKAKRRDAVTDENARLLRENERLKRRLVQTEAIIAAQKKISEILRASADDPTATGDDES